MKLPRDVGGEKLATLLGRYGYTISRQTGSHLQLSSCSQRWEHHVTIPRHKPLRVGTLSAVLNDVAGYLERDKGDLVSEIFGG